MTKRGFLQGVLGGSIAGLPEVKSIERLQVTPETLLVLNIPGRITAEHVQYIRESFERVMPGQKVLILTEGMTLTTIAK